jgi:hypothetical protein
LLSLGVLLLLAAGVTFLAVTWDSLPVSIQAAIMAFLASVALVGAVPASRHRLSGTAEALAILGCGLLAVDLYGARALGLIPMSAIGGLTYAGLSCALIAAINLLMSRIAPKVLTFGLAAVIVGQLPLTLVLSDRVDLAVLLLGLLAQVAITLLWTTKGTRTVRITGAICAALVFGAILITGCGRIFLGLVAHYDSLIATTMASLSQVLPVTGVIGLAAMTGLLLLRRASLPTTLPPALGECICAAAAALAFATCLPQLPGGERWWTTGAATALALAELFRARRTGVILAMLRTALIVVAGSI